MAHLNIDPQKLRFRAMIGVGGIGSGAFFQLNGNHSLGREESRSGHFLDQRDYCKLHIICHYVKNLLGPGFEAYPVGKVGEDDAGLRLLQEMQADGLDVRYVRACPGEQTLYSLCFLYPDGSGGNLTTDNSACDRVGPQDVHQAEAEFRRFSGRGIALAAPEVSLPVREALLELASENHLYRAASFSSAEMPLAMERGLIAKIDLLAINLDEAARAAGYSGEERSPEALVEAAVRTLSGLNPALSLSITAGKLGSWSWDGQELERCPALRAGVSSTAGAGDAHMSGVLCGLAAGLPLAEAQQLGGLVAAHSVTSPHTIDKSIARDSLRAFAGRQSVEFPPSLLRLLEMPA